MIVEVFKTNIRNAAAARSIIRQLEESYPGFQVNFDLEDCDKILRIAAHHPICTGSIIRLVRSNRHEIELLL